MTGSALAVDAGTLSGRPTVRSASEQVQMEMIHGLAAILAGIHHHAVALDEAAVPGDLRGCPQQVTEQRTIIQIGIGQRVDVFARHYEHMHRRLRMKVRKGVAKLVLENRGRGNASFNDLAENTIHGGTSVQERLAATVGLDRPGVRSTLALAAGLQANRSLAGLWNSGTSMSTLAITAIEVGQCL